MKKQAILGVIVVLCVLVLGMAVVIYSQSASMQKLADENAKISYMDWILLTTRVRVLEDMLKDDLAATFSPTSYSFDRNTGKIRIAVQVDQSWQSRRLDEVNKAFTERAARLCFASIVAGNDIGDPSLLIAGGPNSYCSIVFFTIVLDETRKGIERKDIAVFENGKLSLK